MTTEVAALHISQDNGSEEMATADSVDDAQNETHESGTSNPIAQGPPLSRPKLADLPSFVEPRWISAESRSMSSRSQSAPFDTASIFSKTTQQSSSPTKTSRSRSKSPVKTMADLRLLNRKVQSRTLDAGQFPDQIRDLWNEMEIIQSAERMIPAEIKDKFIELRPLGKTKNYWWSETQNQQFSQMELLQELNTMVKIRNKTLDFNRTPALEAGWNCDVHSVMLRQMTEHLPGIEQENVTAVRLDTKLIPQVGAIDAESKLVDFALVADESLIPPELVEQVIADPENGVTSISNTTYERVRFRPICVSIETKTPDGKESTALVQLSLWATTHFNRLRTLLPPTQRHIVSMPLPLIKTVGGRYSLFFAIDGEDEISIVGGESDFGNTGTLEGCYQVLAGLEKIGQWVREVYVPWFVANCLLAMAPSRHVEYPPF
jgi:hypothetical protein